MSLSYYFNYRDEQTRKQTMNADQKFQTSLTLKTMTTDEIIKIIADRKLNWTRKNNKIIEICYKELGSISRNKDVITKQWPTNNY